MRFRLSEHAVERFLERHAEAAELADEEARHILLAELDRSIPFGAQTGDGKDYLALLPCELVAAIRREDDVLNVKTVLTKVLAIVNMEAQGIVVGPEGVAHLLALRVDNCNAVFGRTTEELDAILCSLAEEHFRLGMGKKTRNNALRREGFDPAGEDGVKYRAAFEGVKVAFIPKPAD